LQSISRTRFLKLRFTEPGDFGLILNSKRLACGGGNWDSIANQQWLSQHTNL